LDITGEVDVSAVLTTGTSSINFGQPLSTKEQFTKSKRALLLARIAAPAW